MLAISAVLGCSAPACAQQAAAKPKPDAAKSTAAAAKPDPKKSAPTAAAKPVAIETFGSWGTYAAGSGRAKTCYALGQPTKREPDLKRDDAYVFVSTRPGESVRNEVSIVMGFDVKADSTPTAQVGSANFDMVSKGANLWVKNPAAEGQFVEAMRKTAKLVVKAASTRGHVTTDTYNLTGLAQALDRVQKECP